MTIPVFEDEREYRIRSDGMVVFKRRAFFRDYFDYKPGQHVVFGGPSTDGKTTLAFDALEYNATPSFQAFVAVSKPRDPVTAQRGAQLGFRRVSEWPPPPIIGEMLRGQKPPGYLIWPTFGDLDTDMERCAQVTGTLLMERYANGASRKSTGGILVMDDTMVKAKIMGLDNHMVTILAMAGAMDLGLWIFVQRPADSGRTSLWGYENATHLFITRGGDDRMKKRYSEIIGQNGTRAGHVLGSLNRFQFLYVHLKEHTMCIVDAS